MGPTVKAAIKRDRKTVMSFFKLIKHILEEYDSSQWMPAWTIASGVHDLGALILIEKDKIKMNPDLFGRPIQEVKLPEDVQAAVKETLKKIK